MVERCDALDGYFSLCWDMNGGTITLSMSVQQRWNINEYDRPYDSICAFSDDIEHLVIGACDEVRHSFIHIGS